MGVGVYALAGSTVWAGDSIVDSVHVRAKLEEDPTLQRAVVRSIDIIGEASKRVPLAVRDAHLG